MAELFTSSYYLHLFTTFSSDEKGFFMIGFNVRGDPVNKAPIIVYILQSSEKLKYFCDFQIFLALLVQWPLGHRENLQNILVVFFHVWMWLWMLAPKSANFMQPLIFHHKMRFWCKN